MAPPATSSSQGHGRLRLCTRYDPILGLSGAALCLQTIRRRGLPAHQKRRQSIQQCAPPGMTKVHKALIGEMLFAAAIALTAYSSTSSNLSVDTKLNSSGKEIKRELHAQHHDKDPGLHAEHIQPIR
ncbi:hypothetical protein ElyMa_002875400 [Elysia marginata]|uniref:Uncharacterized protein n=1 Tax=Elysia marginata TaxID=1093978 RepID=A0AAV4HXC6_9GAST|nr:hypothetical protein ElyMa_002875400 [Elysia marginata]